MILVNENDEVVGFETKMQTHIQEKLHRAFSLFIYNKTNERLLIHKRAEGKYHSGGLWTNSCCSHPRKGESLRKAVVRRVKQELGLSLSEEQLAMDDLKSYEHGLHELDSFRYYEKFSNCSEHEIDHVFFLPLYMSEIILDVDSEEISEVKWVTLDELKEWLRSYPEDFTAWFAPALKIVIKKVFTESQIII